MKILMRKDAILQNETRYFNGKPCKKGHLSPKYTLSGTCVACVDISTKNNHEKNPKRRLFLSKLWVNKNTEKRFKAQQSYRQKNAAKVNLWTASYRSAKDFRQPPWLNAGQLFEMESVYNYCSALRNVGLDYHVDHIVPLRGDNVSGLHVPWNLQVITKAENMSKGNRFNG